MEPHFAARHGLLEALHGRLQLLLAGACFFAVLQHGRALALVEARHVAHAPRVLLLPRLVRVVAERALVQLLLEPRVLVQHKVHLLREHLGLLPVLVAHDLGAVQALSQVLDRRRVLDARVLVLGLGRLAEGADVADAAHDGAGPAHACAIGPSDARWALHRGGSCGTVRREDPSR